MIINETRHDFRQRYRTCIVKVFEGTHENIFYIDDVSEHLDILIGSTLNKYTKDWIPKSYIVEGIDIDFTWPILGTVNINSEVYRVSRIPRTQYRQAYSETLITYTPVNIEIHNMLRNKKGKPMKHFSVLDFASPRIVLDLFYPKYFSLRTAMSDLLIGRKYSVAINKDFYLTLKWNLEGIFLGYKDGEIGKMVSNNLYTPSVNLFEGNEDLNEVVSEQGIRIGGIENAR